MGHDDNNFDEVGELLGTLKRVDAPGDFDVRVRARIAKGRPAAGRSWPLVLARIGAPAAVLIALGGYFGWSVLNQPVNVPAVADVQQPAQIEPSVREPIGQAPIAPEDFLATRNPGPGLNSNVPVPGNRAPDRVNPRDEEGFSEDFGITPGRRILPRGLDPDGVINVPAANISKNSRRSASEMLGMLGIAASCSAAGCRVGSVVTNSIAEKSGVKAGDVIESIDGRSLLGSASFSGSFSATNLRVRRDGSITNIALRP